MAPPTNPSPWRATVAQQGYAVATVADLGLDVADAARVPWDFATQLFGRAPRMLERQPIRAVPDGRSFASTDRFCPVHTDSQWFDGGPPHAQVMVCEQHADDGGETLLVDAWAFAAALERDDRALFDALFDVTRTIPFLFGDVRSPTLALHAGDLVFTHAPFVDERDALAVRLAAALARAPVLRVPVATGQLLVVDNHRMLHGRTAFLDHRRSFTRLLVWLDAALSPAVAVGERLRARAAASPRAPSATAATARDLPEELRLQLVLAMTRGVPPGVLARRHALPEAQLYRLRDVALRAARDALRAAGDP